MKKIALRSAGLAVIAAFLSETHAYLKGWRTAFFSFSELVSILSFAAFLFIPIVACYLAVLKIIKEKELFTVKRRAAVSAVSLACSFILLYYDDNKGWNRLLSVSAIPAILIVGFIMFLGISFGVYLYKKDKQ